MLALLLAAAFAGPLAAPAIETQTIRVGPGEAKAWTTKGSYTANTYYLVHVDGRSVLAERVPGTPVVWLYRSGTVIKVTQRRRWTFEVTNTALLARSVRVRLTPPVAAAGQVFTSQLTTW